MLCGAHSVSMSGEGKRSTTMTSKWFTSLVSGVALVGFTLTSAFPARRPSRRRTRTAPASLGSASLAGSAVVQRGDSNKQVAAAVNAPLLPGDYISTGATSRAELQFDGYTAVRLGRQRAGPHHHQRSEQPRAAACRRHDRGWASCTTATRFQVDTPSVTVRAQAGRRLSHFDREGRLDAG